MADRPGLKIFLSAVTGVFADERAQLATWLNQGLVNTIRTQEELLPTGGDTVRTLDDFIANSHFVVHIVGAEAGAPLRREAIGRFLKAHPELSNKLPWLAAELARPEPTVSPMPKPRFAGVHCDALLFRYCHLKQFAIFILVTPRP